MKTYDAIVLGLGAMGSATLYQLARRGARVLGIDQFNPPHKLGSTHGETRITRLAIGEGREYVPLALRSHEIWRELESQTGVKLLHSCGGLIVATSDRGATRHHGRFNFLEETITAAKKFSIAHEELGAAELRARFPQFCISGDERGYYEPEAGYLLPELCVETQLRRARELGAEIVTQTKVTGILNDANGEAVQITTGDAKCLAHRAVICAGPWIKNFLPPVLADQLKIYRQILYWFELAADESDFLPGRMPIFIWTSNAAESFYGFPALNGKTDGLKLAFSEYDLLCHPDNVPRNVTAAEIDAAARVFAMRLPVTSKCLRTATCLYTVTPDSDFLIDWHPDIRGALIASPCSGHGFKHSAALGEALAELALNAKSALDIARFRIRW